MARATAEYRRGCGALCGRAQPEGSVGRAGRGVSRRLHAQEAIAEKAIKGRVRTRHIVALSRILIEPDGYFHERRRARFDFFFLLAPRFPRFAVCFRIFTPPGPPTNTCFASLRNSPCSTTPTVSSSCLATFFGSEMGPNAQSRM